MTRFRLFLLMAVAAAATAGTAHAGLLPVNVTVTPDGSNFRWTYAVVLPTDSAIKPGDFFTIYDFGGLVSGSVVQPGDWIPQVSKSGPTPGRVNPGDDPNIDNLTFTYDGATIPSGQIGLGNFWAVSMYGVSTDSFFTATTHRTSDGKVDTNITEVVVPVPVAPSTVPEPATFALAALGLPLVGWARRRRTA
jgi:hypothetical protein